MALSVMPVLDMARFFLNLLPALLGPGIINPLPFAPVACTLSAL
jgi:hypothetical protein